MRSNLSESISGTVFFCDDMLPEIGFEFEYLFSIVARKARDLEGKKIYRLREWPGASEYGLDGQDIGVDRVAILNDDTVVAIQCKCYKEEHKVNKKDVEKFLAGSQNQVFNLRWLVTTSDLTDQVEKMLKNTNIKKKKENLSLFKNTY